MLNKSKDALTGLEPHKDLMQNTTRQKLLQLMSDGCIHSGAALGTALGISRTAIWKQIQSLETQGVPVETLQGKGYRLSSPIEILDKQQILTALPARQRSRLTLDIFDELASTNSHIMAQLKDMPAAPWVCMAEQQTAGRGRRGRQWLSPYASSLAMSMLWQFSGSADRLAGLSLAVGVAIMAVLEQLNISNAQLKWPNDIVCKDRKVGGVLIEVSGDMAGPCYVVIGIGLNTAAQRCNDHAGMQHIEQAWTDLNELLPAGQNISRNKLSALLIDKLLDMLDQFEQQGFAAFHQSFKTYDALCGRDVVLQRGGENTTGLAVGVDVDGCLLIKNAQGTEAINSGEVSVRAVSSK